LSRLSAPTVRVACHVCGSATIVATRQRYTEIEQAHRAVCQAQVMLDGASLADLFDLPAR
jgi:hypothetical protein